MPICEKHKVGYVSKCPTCEFEKNLEKLPKPICPCCKKEMKREMYRGYYESFAYWGCECGDEDIPLDEDWHGAYR